MISVPPSVLRELVRGAVEIESTSSGLRPIRLPAWTRLEQFDHWIEHWSAQSLGVSLAMRTAASRLELDLELTRILPPGLAQELFPASIVVEVDGRVRERLPVEAGPVIRTMPDRSAEVDPGPSVTLAIDLGAATAPREVRVWLPHNGSTVLQELRADAAVETSGPVGRPRWVHHGSSVSHGLEATDPLGPWPQQVARALGLELTDLAIAGNAQLDPFVGRTIAAVPADVVSLKLGVNVVNGDTMRARAFVPALHGFLDLVREGHPGVPILVLSPIACPAIESTPGPTLKLEDGRYHGSPRATAPGDGTLTLGLVRELVRSVVEVRRSADSMLWFDDGLRLLGEADADLLWDALHPNQEGYDLMARRFVERARGATPTGEAFAGVLRR